MNLAPLAEALQVTWPAKTVNTVGNWHIRDGAGAGRRASAATPLGPVAEADIDQAEKAMRKIPMPPLFAVRGDQPALEALLSARGYRDHDHSIYYAAPVERLAKSPPPPVTTFEIWPPLAIMEDIWRANDLAQPRIDLMQRATCAKTALFGRTQNRAAGAAFVGAHNGYALLHALVVDNDFRRSGLGQHLTVQAALWAQNQGCHTLALAVSRDNNAALALYASLGMEPVGEYHYRSLPE